MREVTFGGKRYVLDDEDYLIDQATWEDAFAEGMASRVGIDGALSPGHWQVIRFIRKEFEADGECPIIFRVCKVNKLKLADFKRLFPAGYLRGACKLAGITHADRPRNFYGEHAGYDEPPRQRTTEKSYRVNAFGFLLDPAEWDEHFALHKAEEIGMAHGLSPRQWQVVRFLRARNEREHEVPTVFETCEALGLELSDLEELFPAGYHRGALKVAGLRVRV